MNLKHFAQEFFLHESIHITMFFSVLALFFFLYVTKKEEEGIVGFIFGAFNLRQSNPPTSIVKNAVDALSPTDIATAKNNARIKYKERMSENHKLVMKTVFLILGIAIAFLAINLTLYFTSRRDYVGMPVKTLVMNILGVVLLGCIEFTFFTLIASKYKQLTTDELYIQIINRIRNLPAVVNNPEAEQIQLELAKMLFNTGLYNNTNTNTNTNGAKIV